MIIYTGVAPERACVAFGNDDLSELEKFGGNPVIAGPPRGLATPGFRDHSVWREDGEWRMIIGSGESGRSGLALGYRSPDLLGWEYDGVFCLLGRPGKLADVGVPRFLQGRRTRFPGR